MRKQWEVAGLGLIAQVRQSRTAWDTQCCLIGSQYHSCSDVWHACMGAEQSGDSRLEGDTLCGPGLWAIANRS